MKNLVLIFSFLLLVVNCYTQQFTFNELLLMTNDYKVFELNMIKKNNRPIKQENPIVFSFETNSLSTFIICAIHFPLTNLIIMKFLQQLIVKKKLIIIILFIIHLNEQISKFCCSITNKLLLSKFFFPPLSLK